MPRIRFTNLFAERISCLGVAQRDAIANAIDGIAPVWLRGLRNSFTLIDFDEKLFPCP